MTISARVSAQQQPAPTSGEVATIDLRTVRVHQADRAKVSKQISHDMNHELGTIMMLASVLAATPELDETSRDRARQILGETRWLQQLHRAYEDNLVSVYRPDRRAVEAVRLDHLVREVVAAIQLSTLVRIGVAGEEAWAYVDRLAFWRALRNLVGNAVRAAGAQGRVEVRITVEWGWAVLEVEDDGPGFGSVPAGDASLGLDIVMNLAATWGGQLEIRRGVLGGCCVRLRLPAAAQVADPALTGGR
jgi:signal transduction histidine kinase